MSQSYLAVSTAEQDPLYPFAPLGWSETEAQQIAQEEGIEFGPVQRSLVNALQEFIQRNDGLINLRDLNDALEEAFHHQGGLKYLHEIFPGGPIAQGCRMAGLKAPAGTTDKSFGSVR